MKRIVIIAILTLTLALTTTVIQAKSLGLNCDALTDVQCSCVAGYVSLAYYDIDTVTRFRDKGMSSLLWIWQKSLGNCITPFIPQPIHPCPPCEPRSEDHGQPSEPRISSVSQETRTLESDI